MNPSARLLLALTVILVLGPALIVALIVGARDTAAADTAHGATAQPVPPTVTVVRPVPVLPPTTITAAPTTTSVPPTQARKVRQTTAQERAARVAFTPAEVQRAWIGKEHERAVMAEDGTLVPESYYAQKVTRANKPTATAGKARTEGPRTHTATKTVTETASKPVPTSTASATTSKPVPTSTASATTSKPVPTSTASGAPHDPVASNS